MAQRERDHLVVLKEGTEEADHATAGASELDVSQRYDWDLRTVEAKARLIQGADKAATENDNSTTAGYRVWVNPPLTELFGKSR